MAQNVSMIGFQPEELPWIRLLVRASATPTLGTGAGPAGFGIPRGYLSPACYSLVRKGTTQRGVVKIDTDRAEIWYYGLHVS
jgi:hypothetical protein